MSEPTITSKNLPPVQHPAGTPPSMPKPLSTVEVQIPYGDIVAKPLRSPNFINLKHKNPNMSLFWGNRAVGEKESGLRYDQLIAMGFQPAKPENIITVEGIQCPPSLCRDGRIMYGDLILLMMPRSDFVGNQKWNEQNARLRVKKPGVVIEGDTQGSEGRISPSSAFAGVSSKVQPYVPNLAEVSALTKDNT